MTETTNFNIKTRLAPYRPFHISGKSLAIWQLVQAKHQSLHQRYPWIVKHLKRPTSACLCLCLHLKDSCTPSSVLLYALWRTGGDHQDALVLRRWRLSSKTWNPKTSPWKKQLPWLRIVYPGDWCLRLALRSPSGACHKRTRYASATG